MCNGRDFLKDKKRIVVKIGSSSLMHSETGKLDLLKIERLVRALVDIKNSGKEVILVSSGAIAVGKTAIGLHERPDELPVKQACAAIGQAKLMMVYQKLFAEYGTIAAQVLLTKYTMLNPVTRTNAENTFKELAKEESINFINKIISALKEDYKKIIKEREISANSMLNTYIDELKKVIKKEALRHFC